MAGSGRNLFALPQRSVSSSASFARKFCSGLSRNGIFVLAFMKPL